MKDNSTYACEACKEPTKQFAGFMDGHDKDGRPTHGILYTCKNKSCPHFKDFDDNDTKIAVEAINKTNGVNVRILRDKLHATHNTMGSVAQLLGVGPAQVSRWLNGHEAIPKETYDYLMHMAGK